MAEDVDHESKTESPTERRVREAIEKGDVPVAREASVLAALVGLLIVLTLFVRSQAATLARDSFP